MALADAVARIRGWRDDPVQFVRDNFQVEPDAWQVDALRSLRTEGVNRLCMKACAGPGKSAVLAWLGWWFLGCFGKPGEHPKGAAVATTADNLKDNLWPELSKWQQRSAYLKAAFTYQKERIFAKDHPETWFLSARSFSKSADPSEQGRALSGLHSEYPFVLIDESGDISPSIGRAAEQAMGNCRMGLIAQAGNPTSHDGLLYESCTTLRDKHTIITITSDPDDPKRTPRVNIDWARDQIRRFGRSNPWVMAYVLGMFPPGSMNSLLTMEEVENALGKHIPELEYNFAPRILACDPARFGDDRTVILRRQGLACFNPDILRGERSPEIAGRMANRCLEWDPEGIEGIFIDGGGNYGIGAEDMLRQGGYRPIMVFGHLKADDERFFNKRSESWWLMAEWVKKGGALPPIPELAKELTTPTYYFQEGKLRLEEKDQIKKRLGCSPDIADALALTFAFPVRPKSLRLGNHDIGHAKPNSKPFNPLGRVGGYGR